MAKASKNETHDNPFADEGKEVKLDSKPDNDINLVAPATDENGLVGEPSDDGNLVNEALVTPADPSRMVTKTVLVEEPTEAELDRPVDPDKGPETPALNSVTTPPPGSGTQPNAHADALAMVRQAQADAVGDLGERVSFRADPDATGARDARDLAKFLERYPQAIYVLGNLDDYERDVLGVADPAPWVKHPVDLLPEAKRHNFYFVGANGNYINS